MTDQRFGACILAAGFSSRMGAFKPLLPLGDETVIQRVVRVSKEAGIRDIFVVCGHNREALLQEADSLQVKAVFNPRFAEGMFTSIQAGTAALPSELDGFFIMPVDCPLVTAEVLKQLMAEFRKDRFAVPCYRGKKGHPLLVPAAYREEILSHNGKGGLKAITDRDFEKMVRVETGQEGVVMDMDTPQAYEEIKRFLAGGCKSDSLQQLGAGRRFFLIRHGQIRQHKDKIFLGQTDVPLSEEGHRQAAAAGEKLAQYRLSTDRIYTSDLLRAQETAQWISQKTGIEKILPLAGLREMSLGPWDGRLIEDIKKEYPKEFELRGKHLFTYKMGHGSENFYDLQYRVVNCLAEILKTDPAEDLVLTAHSGVLRAVSNNLKGMDISAPWDKLKNGGMEIISLPAAGQV